MKQEIPEEILTNLPPEMKAMLVKEVVQAREEIVQENIRDTSDVTREDLVSQSNLDAEQPSASNDNRSDLDELLDLVNDLDEDTSRVVYNELQTILEEVNLEVKKQKIDKMKEELIQLQIEQTKLLPPVPAEVTDNLPPEMSESIRHLMKDALLTMASTAEQSKKTEVKEMITEFLTSDDENETEESKTPAQPPPPPPPPPLVLSSLPEDLLSSLPPDMADLLQANFEASVRQLTSDSEERHQEERQLEGAHNGNEDDLEEGEMEDSDNDNEDDVSLPPTPAVQPPWSLIASQPQRPGAPTPNSQPNKEDSQSPFSFKDKRNISQESSETLDLEENVAAKDPRSVTPEVIDLAKETVAKVIEDAKDVVSKMTVEKDTESKKTKTEDEVHVSVSHMTSEGRVTVNQEDQTSQTKRKLSTIISTEELYMKSDNDEDTKSSSDEQKTDTRKIVMNISNETTNQQAESSGIDRFEEVSVIKDRTCTDEDRFREAEQGIDSPGEPNQEDPSYGARGVRDTLNTPVSEDRAQQTENNDKRSDVTENAHSPEVVEDDKDYGESPRGAGEVRKFLNTPVESEDTTQHREDDEEQTHVTLISPGVPEDVQDESKESPEEATAVRKILPVEPSAETVQEEGEHHEGQSEGARGVRKILNTPTKPSEDTTQAPSDKDRAVGEILKGEDQPEEIVKESDIEEVEFERKSDEEILLMENMKFMTDIMKRKMNDSSRNFRFETRTEVQTFESVKEVKEMVDGHLNNTRAAIQERRVTVIQQTIITMVETVSHWLDRVEYKISTIKKIKTINQKRAELKNIKEEIEVIEETVDELVEVTDLAVEIMNDEAKVTVTCCVNSLTDHVKIVKLHHQQSEEELTDSEDRWEDYLAGVATVKELVTDLRTSLQQVEESEEISPEKIESLESFHTLNKSHTNKIVYLMATGNGLAKAQSENRVPQEMLSLFESVKQIENKILREKDNTITILLSKEEYEQTLAEYSDIIAAAETFLRPHISVLNIQHLAAEIEKQKRFFINLSQCSQVLASLEDGFSLEVRRHYEETHRSLTSLSVRLMEQSAPHLSGLDSVLASWAGLLNENERLLGELEEIQCKMSRSGKYSVENYQQQLTELRLREVRLRQIVGRKVCLEKEISEIQNSVHCLELGSCLDQLSDRSQETLQHVQSERQKLEGFQSLWSSYLSIQSTIQPWLGAVEDQIENEGSVDLAYSEMTTYSNIHQTAGDNFVSAISSIELEDEDEQRKLHLQIENRWNALKQRLEFIRAQRTEIDFHNIDGLALELDNILDQVRQQTEVSMEKFKSNEDFLAYLQKLNFLLVVLKRKEGQILSFNSSNTEELTNEKIGSLRIKCENGSQLLIKKVKSVETILEKSLLITKKVEMVERRREELSLLATNIYQRRNRSNIKHTRTILQVRLNFW